MPKIMKYFLHFSNNFWIIYFSLVFACLGFLSPANRGALMTCVLVNIAKFLPFFLILISLHAQGFYMPIYICKTPVKFTLYLANLICGLPVYVKYSCCHFHFSTILLLLFIWRENEEHMSGVFFPPYLYVFIIIFPFLLKVLFVCLGTVGGYVSSRMYKSK